MLYLQAFCWQTQTGHAFGGDRNMANDSELGVRVEER